MELCHGWPRGQRQWDSNGAQTAWMDNYRRWITLPCIAIIILSILTNEQESQIPDCDCGFRFLPSNSMSESSYSDATAKSLLGHRVPRSIVLQNFWLGLPNVKHEVMTQAWQFSVIWLHCFVSVLLSQVLFDENWWRWFSSWVPFEIKALNFCHKLFSFYNDVNFPKQEAVKTAR